MLLFMTLSLLQLYHFLPSPLQSMVASFRGFYLRAWRYGPGVEQLVEQALERDNWPVEKWNQWQQERLAYVLHRAATRIPYYRDYWAQVRRSGRRVSWDRLDHWPILDKQRVQENPLAFIADDMDKGKMFHEHTSGTTGKPLELYWSRETVRGFYALFEARWHHWYGVSRFDRWAVLGGQLVTSYKRTKPPFWVWNAAMNQLYMSSYHLSPRYIPYYLDALKRYQVKYIFGYSSSLYAIAQEILRSKRTDLRLAVAITNAEPLFEYQRQTIGEAFNCPVRETYGNSEIVASASECDSGQLHLWPELGYVEILRSSESGTNDKIGDLIGTSILNVDMPLIRYRLGDRVTLATREYSCPCGRTLPVLKSVEGRADDVLYTSDGRIVGRLDPVFKTQLPLREVQIVQDALNRIRVRYVPIRSLDATSAQIIVSRLRERLGPVQVEFEELTEIPREQNGKFRAVICNLRAEEKMALKKAIFGTNLLSTGR